MKILYTGIVFFLLIATTAFSQPHIVAQFTPHSHSYDGTTIPYRLYVPQNMDTSRVYPLVLALHGSGERGDDNLIHIQGHRLATSWADPLNQADYPCFVVAPQCPQNSSWTYSFTGPIGPELATVVDLIDSLRTVFPVDSNRLYVTGLSMGGFGTWDLIQRFPGKFAAAIPMSAGGDPSQIGNITHIPVWNFHGKLDNDVPVSLSRDMMTALENAGESVIYTHCKYENCTGLPDSSISMYVESHALHFYTEYENGQHVIWAQSYDYPHLFPWVFSQYRMIRNSVRFTNLNSYRTLSLLENINWTSLHSDGSADIWFSPDLGRTWQIVADSIPNTGSSSWNTELVDDCAFGMLKILPKNSDGFIYGRAVSSPFAIDNGMNGSPFVKITGDEFDKGLILVEDSLQLNLLMGDPEQSPLTTTIGYSVDAGDHFETISSFASAGDTMAQPVTLAVNTLANSATAVIRVSVSDGQNTYSDQTYHFSKQTPRHSVFQASHVAGDGDATVTIQIVDPAQLTGDLYRVSFDDSSFGEKVYNVYNATAAQFAVQNAVQLDGISEGPYFDGIRLLIKDYDPPEINFAETGWQNSATTLELFVHLPSISMGSYVLNGVPYPADYRITVSDMIVDTSSTAFGVPAIPMKFSVENVTENRPAELIFADNDGNNQISLHDDLYLIERDSLDDPYLIWAVTVRGDSNPVAPQAGDQFLLKIFKPVSAVDLYEFSGELNLIRKDISQPEKFRLYSNYPNPFNPGTTIQFDLLKSGHVILKIFNILGEEVKTLVNHRLSPGSYSYRWNAGHLASGLYFYRLQAGEYQETHKMILMK